MSYYKDRRESGVLIKNRSLAREERAWQGDITRDATSCIRPDGREREEITLQIRTLARRETQLTTGDARNKSIDDAFPFRLIVSCVK